MKQEIRKVFGTWAQCREVIWANNRLPAGTGYDYYELEPVTKYESWMNESHFAGKRKSHLLKRININSGKYYKLTLYRDKR